MMILAHFGDAAFAANLDGTDFAGVFGYLDAPNALHPWTEADWDAFPGWKVPTWVAGVPDPRNRITGAAEGRAAVAQLRALKVPAGCLLMLDMEARKDDTYVDAFGQVIHDAGYKALMYGSADTAELNPPLNGYVLAEYGPGGSPLATEKIMELLRPTNVRGVQYASNRLYDSSLMKHWTEGEMWK